MNQSLAVEMRGITKRFPGVLANDHVDFAVRHGEVHALLGENGAGKSTLMNILYGLYRPDGGEILWQDRPVQFRSPHDAIALGIGMVHQTFQLIPTLTVAQNVVLGLRSRRGPFYDAADAEARIRDLSERYGLTLDPRARVDRLDVGTQQRVEIIKALYRQAKLLILDEPTSVLTPKETQELIIVLRRLVSEGHSVVFISHKLDEVMQLSDRVTVLRDGRVVGTSLCCDTSSRQLAVMMVGRQLPELMAKIPVGDSPAERSRHGVVLRLEGVSALSEQRLPVLRDVTLQVRAGEIVGIAGVAGNGQHELAEVVTGLHPASAGRVVLRGRDITRCSPRIISEQGVAYVPENPRQMCVFPDFTLEQNAILKTYRQPPLARHGFLLDSRRIQDFTRQLMHTFDVRAPGPKTLARQLSGGNLQKLVLARELSRAPTVIVSAQPTVGLDVIATLYIRQRLLEQRARGCAILLVSADLDEVIGLSDRVAVMYEGQIMGELSAEQINMEELGLMMAGARRNDRVSL